MPTILKRTATRSRCRCTSLVSYGRTAIADAQACHPSQRHKGFHASRAQHLYGKGWQADETGGGEYKGGGVMGILSQLGVNMPGM